MGKFMSKIFGNKEMRILMLGLDAAGKTSILQRQCIVSVQFKMHYYYIAQSIVALYLTINTVVNFI